MNLPTLDRVDIAGKKVLLRMDLDVANDYSRIDAALKTLAYLVENQAKTIILGHRGRPGGKVSKELSLEATAEHIGFLLGKNVDFITAPRPITEALVMFENLRFNLGEEEGSNDFAKSLALLGEIYVNEAFAASHRSHASIVGIPKFLPHAAGFRFSEEVENLSKVLVNPRKPVIVLISGIKEDKVEMAKAFAQKVDKVLVGGRLPEFFGDNTTSIRTQNDEKLIIANLNMDKEDITLNSIERFKDEISKAGTIVLAGVLGKYEDEGHRQGTKEIFTAIAESDAFKVAGGGDTEAALTMLGLTKAFDWISVGGGAMLQFLIKESLPGIEALLE